jgi:hypothetical protein
MPGRRGRTSGHPSLIYLLLKTVFSIYCVQCVHVGDFLGFLSSTVRPLSVQVCPLEPGNLWRRPPNDPLDLPWCKCPFTPRSTGGRPQRFCSQGCRRAEERAMRQWACQSREAGKTCNARCYRRRAKSILDARRFHGWQSDGAEHCQRYIGEGAIFPRSGGCGGG